MVDRPPAVFSGRVLISGVAAVASVELGDERSTQVRRADVTAVENQRIRAALGALPGGADGPFIIKRMSDCEVH